MGKFINLLAEDSKLSLFILTASCAIFTPAVIYMLIEQQLNKKAALIAFLLSLSSPYLFNLSLTMLSDSVGLFFFFLGLYFLQKKQYKTSGLILSIAFFSRPSYLILYLIGLVYLFLYKKEAVKTVVTFFMLGVILFLCFIFINEGTLYIIEAKRFVFGHFNLWGTGQNSTHSWISQLFSLVHLIYILLIFILFNFDKRLKLYYVLFIFYLIWIVTAQNPENIRHMIPLVLLGNILLASILFQYKMIFTTLLITFNLFFFGDLSQKISPIEQIVPVVKNDTKMIITNRGIEILRKYQKNSVIDKYYVHSSSFINKNQASYIINTTKPPSKNYKEYKGRFIGEQTLYLYEQF